MGYGEGIGDMFGALGHKRAGQRKDTASENYQNMMFLLGGDYWKQFYNPKAKKDIYRTYDPWVEGGTEAQNALTTSTLGDYDQFRESPGYRYSVDQAEKSINRNALATGVYGGNRSKALVDEAQHLADQDYQQYLGNLNALSTTGLNATNSRNQLWEQFASGKVNLMAGGAAARMEGAYAAANELAAGYAQGGKAIQSGVEQIIGGISGMSGSGGGMGSMSSFGIGGGS